MVSYFLILLITCTELAIIFYICSKAEIFPIYKRTIQTKLKPNTCPRHSPRKDPDNKTQNNDNDEKECEENNYLFLMV